VVDDFFNNELKKFASTPSEVPVMPPFVPSIYSSGRKAKEINAINDTVDPSHSQWKGQVLF
jgi:hypothetical protein